MSALAVFAFGEQIVRISDREGEPWFVGRDVCSALAIVRHEQALARVPADEKGSCIVGTPGGNQTMIVISEPGMYRLVLTSRTAAAERFKTWVVGEVLPAIRRTGRYAPAAPANDTGEIEADGFDFETDTGRATILVKLALVRGAGRSFGRAAAQEAWRRVGLPDVAPAAAGGFVGVEDSDITAWLFDRVETSPADRVASAALYADYVAWCHGRATTARSLAWFAKRLRFAGVEFRKSSSVYAIGVKLRGWPAMAA